MTMGGMAGVFGRGDLAEAGMEQPPPAGTPGPGAAVRADGPCICVRLQATATPLVSRALPPITSQVASRLKQLRKLRSQIA